MKIPKYFLTACLVFAAADAAQEPEYPFNLDVELLWMQRNRSPDQDLVNWGSPFCYCECGVNNYSTTMLIDDLDRTLGFRITGNIRNKDKGTMELRGTTPFDFSSVKNIYSPAQTNAACDLSYGYIHVDQDASPYVPIFDTVEVVETVPVVINGVTVYETIDYYNTDYIEADRAKIEYDSSYFTLESNYWLHLSPRWKDYFSVSFGFGLRYFSFLEGIKGTFYKSQNSILANSSNVSTFSADTKNHLYGAQVLLDLHIHPYSWFDWGIRMDGGAFAAHQRLINQVNDLNGSVLLSKYTKQTIDYAFFGDLEIFAAVKILGRGYGLFSYGGTLIHGVAQATSNLNLTTKQFPIDDQGNILFQWWSLGLGLDF